MFFLLYLQDSVMDKDTFYGERTVSYRFLRNLVNLCEDAEWPIDIVITEPPAGGDRNDIEDHDDNSVDNETMPQEIASEVDVFYDESAEYTSKTSKRQRRELPKWKSHIVPHPDLIQNKQESANIFYLEIAQILLVSEWAVFDKVFGNMFSCLVSETNKYAWRDCNMPKFHISSQKM